ncbi:MAG: GNAT family N-acetyltransferase [Planctomycetota bacterium]
MNIIELIRLDSSLEDSLHQNPEFIDSMMTENWSRVAELVHAVTGRTLQAAPVGVDQLEWGGYYVVDKATNHVVGSCAFKGEPSDDGSVEIAYFTFPEFEGNGYATLMAERLVSLARSCLAIQRVLAHTLPNESASTRVLEKVGLTYAGPVEEPDDGLVWRWEMKFIRDEG